jgi:hypothetical protein
VPYHPITSPSEKIDSHVKEVLQPVPADFRVLRRESLRGRFWREMEVHLKKRRVILGTTDPDDKGITGSVNALNTFFVH